VSGPDGRLPVKLRHGIRAELWHPSFLLADIPLSVDEHPPVDAVAATPARFCRKRGGTVARVTVSDLGIEPSVLARGPGREGRSSLRGWSSPGSLRMVFTRITSDPAVMAGVPCIRGMRFPVATVIAMVADGLANDEILAEHPDLEPEDIVEALKFAGLAVQERQLPLLLA